MHQSGDAAVNFGNTPPTAVGGVTLVEEKVVVTPVSGRHRSFKLGEYFSDTPGDTLHYVIVSSQLVSDTAAIDGDTLNVETSKSRSGDLCRTTIHLGQLNKKGMRNRASCVKVELSHKTF